MAHADYICYICHESLPFNKYPFSATLKKNALSKDVKLYLLLAAVVVLTALNIMVFDSRQNPPPPGKQIVKESIIPPKNDAGATSGGTNTSGGTQNTGGTPTSPDDEKEPEGVNDDNSNTNSNINADKAQPVPNTAEELEQRLKALELMDVQEFDPSLKVDLRYGTRNNFLGVNMYNGFGKCYLQPEVVKMFSKAQEYLKERYPRYSLLALDCARPRSVQQIMWNKVKGTDQQRYVAAPYPGSIHNYGASVDVTIVDGSERQLDMGTPFDYFGEEAQPRHHQKMLEAGKLTNEQIQNRMLLKEVM